MAKSEGLMARELNALRNAAATPGGWALSYAKTTDGLSRRGWFEKAEHPRLGMIWRITDAGREVLAHER